MFDREYLFKVKFNSEGKYIFQQKRSPNKNVTIPIKKVDSRTGNFFVKVRGWLKGD